MSRAFKWVPSAKDLLDIERLTRMGLGQTQLSEYFGISYDTWIRSKERFPDIVEQISLGRRTGFDTFYTNLNDIAADPKHPKYFEANKLLAERKFGLERKENITIVNKQGDEVELDDAELEHLADDVLRPSLH